MLFLTPSPIDAARRFLRARRGNVLVEFALVTPILAVLCCAIIDYSVYLFAVNNLTTAARQGARRAALQRTVVTDTVVAWTCRAMAYKPPTVTCDSNLVKVEPHTTDSGYVRIRIVNFPYTPLTPVATRQAINRTATFNWEYAAP